MERCVKNLKSKILLKTPSLKYAWRRHFGSSCCLLGEQFDLVVKGFGLIYFKGLGAAFDLEASRFEICG